MYKEYEKFGLWRKCRVWSVADETVAYIVSECSKLAQKEFEQVRHDNDAKMLYWKNKDSI